ncbi:hypothetical protein KUTeg_000292 [Tegillarca granosa]|uniref:Uncharacterized protein n=1 Tax=Tegillarca granosa TaxID=220873 RepID=A0ABQ9G076_TEGGR|nr:hypothetical protein KUTeg_000292 [Tegillarca granosa]
MESKMMVTSGEHLSTNVYTTLLEKNMKTGSDNTEIEAGNHGNKVEFISASDNDSEADVCSHGNKVTNMNASNVWETEFGSQGNTITNISSSGTINCKTFNKSVDEDSYEQNCDGENIKILDENCFYTSQNGEDMSYPTRSRTNTSDDDNMKDQNNQKDKVKGNMNPIEDEKYEGMVEKSRIQSESCRPEIECVTMCDSEVKTGDLAENERKKSADTEQVAFGKSDQTFSDDINTSANDNVAMGYSVNNSDQAISDKCHYQC